MSRITLLTASAAVLLAACTASTDDVGALGEDDTDGLVAEGVSVCPDTEVLDLDDFPSETLPVNAETFHEENGSRDDVITKPSGLQFKVIQPGLENGLSPEPNEYVAANYHGYLIDGTKFDSSYDRGEPLEFSTRRVIPGWTEAIEEMKVCEARTLYIPADIAYGSRGAGDVIPPNASLVFNVQLIKVDRAQPAE